MGTDNLMGRRSLFLALMLVAVVGLPISRSDPELKPVMAKLFFGALTVSGAGQSLLFGKRGTARIIEVCAAALILSIG